MRFPKHLTLYIEHNPHKDRYQTVNEYIQEHEWMKEDLNPAEGKICCEINELWIIQWYPTTQMCFWWVGASTFEKALELALEIEEIKEKHDY